MNYHYASSTNTENHLIPTVEINKKIESKKNVSRTLAISFILVEILCFTSIYFLLYNYRISHEFGREWDLLDWTSPRFFPYFVFYAISSIIYLIFIYRYRIYHLRASSGLSDELYKMIKSYSFAILITVGVSFLLKFSDLSRLVIISYWILAMAGSLILRWAKRQVYFRLANQGIVTKTVLIVGAGKIGKLLIDELDTHKWLGYTVVGFVDDYETDDFKGYPCLGKTGDIKSILESYVIDDLIITIPSEREMVNRLISDLRKIDVKIKIVPDMFNMVMSTVQIGNINALPVVTLVKTPMRGLGLIVKRLFDIFVSSFLVILISPVFLVTAIAIKLDSRGPIIFKQERIGRNGKFFKMYKFRSMVVNAEAQLEKLENHNEIKGIAFKMKNDPRVTRVGRFIRKYSIDELPQLLNVIKGDMSLVGPRPPLPYEVEKYGDWEWRRLEVTPGITGLWQVSGRSDLSFQQWMNLDIYYIENWSLGLDLKILFKTIPVVFKGEGAY